MPARLPSRAMWILAGIAVTAVGSAPGAAAQGNPPGRVTASASVAVQGTANIFWAGHDGAPPVGSPPAVIVLGPGSAGKALVISNVTGQVDCGLGTMAGPDGGTCAGRTDAASFEGIAGIIHRTKTMFLAGVFLDDRVPADPAPARLDFSDRDRDAEIAPPLRSVFFIGDGLTGTGTGAQQRFIVPAGATRLFLGIVDAWDGAIIAGPPCCYGDNKGAFSAVVGFAAATPVPPTPPAVTPVPSAAPAAPPASPTVAMPPASQTSRPRTLTGPWMPSADAAYTGKSQAIFVQDGQRVSLRLAWLEHGSWLTTICEGALDGGKLEMTCGYAPGGNPFNYPASTMTLMLSADGNHLDGVLVDAAGKRQASNWTRKPPDSGPDGWTGPIR